MYNVSPYQLKTFLAKKGITQPIFREAAIPYILEFHEEGKTIAKIEVLSNQEVKNLFKLQKLPTRDYKNKYWIRGQEWKEVDGVLKKELVI